MYSITKSSVALMVFGALLTAQCYAQRNTSPTPFFNYYYDYKLTNPALTGTDAEHVITSAYSGNLSGRDKFYYLSYEGNITQAKVAVGGIGISDEIGLTKRFHSGLFVNKRFAFSPNSGLYVGTQVFLQSTRIDFSRYITHPDDPLIISGSERQRNLGFDLGAVYYWNKLSVGLAAKNIRPSFYDLASVNLLAMYETRLSDRIKATPSVNIVIADDYNAVHLNSVFQFGNWVLAGAGTRFAEGYADLTLNVGINVKDWVQLINHVFWTDGGRMQEYSQTRVESMLRVRIPNTRVARD